MTPSEAFAIEEYRALRATIRERGTARYFVAVLTFVAWAGLVLAASTLEVPPVVTLASLLTLSAGYEVVYASHVGVERVGRYLQTRYERGTAEGPGWEHAAMTLGRNPAAATRTDALYELQFVCAAIVNFVVGVTQAAEPGPQTRVGLLLLALVAMAHLAFVLRVRAGCRFAANQREIDLGLFAGLEKRSTDRDGDPNR